ncbi:uncharacterized protein LOC143537490 [Bidens hawaiensis]|uniref:uncharacterized protein LOC143537490 n=1 Tax=Bidens hawaiensis TaxID=980011 RepID=UPI00404A270C
MDSLLATYASSDEEDEDQQQQSPPSKPIQPSNFFSSLPPPKSQPTNPNNNNNNNNNNPQSTKPTSLFSKLPQPRSESSDPFSLNPKPKKIVQFRPPVVNKPLDDDDEDDDEDAKNKGLPKKDDFLPEAPSVKSFLSSIPAPRNSGSLGAGSSSVGTGRRSILDGEVKGLANSNVVKDNVDNNNSNDINENNNNNAYGDHANANVGATSADYAGYDYGNNAEYQNVGPDYSAYGPAAPVGDFVGYENVGTGYEGYSDYGSYGQYESRWIDRSSGDLQPDVSVVAAVQSLARPPGKRGRNEIPQEVIEVSQDELMKNRPREDQAKSTGIAFGPAYQPTSSAKGKPSKLHKRKHQIGSLYFDMRSKESELAERRSKGFLTKAETHAKYGW